MLLNLGDDAKEQLRLAILHKSHLECFGICVYGIKTIQHHLYLQWRPLNIRSRVYPMRIGPFSSLAEKTLCQGGTKSKEGCYGKGDAKAKLIADVASSRKRRRRLRGVKTDRISERVRRYFSQGPTDGTVVMYAKPQRRMM